MSNIKSLLVSSFEDEDSDDTSDNSSDLKDFSSEITESSASSSDGKSLRTAENTGSS